MSTVVAEQSHVKIWWRDGGTMFERCEDDGCSVGPDGHAGCGRAACPACGCSGSNLSAAQPDRLASGTPVSCSCGHAWLT